MTSEPTPTRRQLLAGTGSAFATFGLSGCLGDDPEQVFTADDVQIRTGDGIEATVSEFAEGSRENVEFTAATRVDQPGDYYLRGTAVDSDGTVIDYQNTTRRLVPEQIETYSIYLKPGMGIFDFLFGRETKDIAGITFHAYRESVVEGDHFINEGGEL